jgi:hypothetical protein
MVHDLQGTSWKRSTLIIEYFAIGKYSMIANYGLRITDSGF